MREINNGLFFPLDLAVGADGFNLYLVDETGKNLRLFNTDYDEYIEQMNKSNQKFHFVFFSSEQASSVVPIRIESGHCLAGYVAFSKESVRITDISTVSHQSSQTRTTLPSVGRRKISRWSLHQSGSNNSGHGPSHC